MAAVVVVVEVDVRMAAAVDPGAGIATTTTTGGRGRWGSLMTESALPLRTAPAQISLPHRPPNG